MSEFMFISTNLECETLEDWRGLGNHIWLNRGDGGKPKLYYRLSPVVLVWVWRQLDIVDKRFLAGKVPQEAVNRLLEPVAKSPPPGGYARPRWLPALLRVVPIDNATGNQIGLLKRRPAVR
jgi:hypothetical protein